MTRHQPLCPKLPIAAHQTLDLPNTQTQTPGCLMLTKSFANDILNDRNSIQLPNTQCDDPFVHQSPLIKKGTF